MDFNSLLQQKRRDLHNTVTIVTQTSGKKFVEVHKDGKAELVAVEGRAPANAHIPLTPVGSLSAGFVLDTKPDTKLYFVVDGLFIGSQDAGITLYLH